jgi:hypothetical protein
MLKMFKKEEKKNTKELVKYGVAIITGVGFVAISDKMEDMLNKVIDDKTSPWEYVEEIAAMGGCSSLGASLIYYYGNKFMKTMKGKKSNK